MRRKSQKTSKIVSFLAAIAILALGLQVPQSAQAASRTFDQCVNAPGQSCTITKTETLTKITATTGTALSASASLAYDSANPTKTVTSSCAPGSYTLYLATNLATSVPAPNGLTFNTTSGSFSGTATSTLTETNYVIAANCNGNTYERFNIKIQIDAGAPALVSSVANVTVAKNTALTEITFTPLNFTGTSCTWASSGTLQTGLALTTTTTYAVIRGTPTAEGNISYQVTRSCSSDSSSASKTVGINVVASLSTKVTICHRTHATTNPYRKITVAISSVQDKGHRVHDEIYGVDHVFNSAVSYPANKKWWGDIIPPDSSGQNRWQEMNWTALGQDIYSGAVAGCAAISTQSYYNKMREAGMSMKDIRADMKEQAADEDASATLTSVTYNGNKTSLTTEDTDKVTICHRTNSTTNPYRRITVDASSVMKKSGHYGHDEIYSGHHVYDSNVTYPNNQKDWGDIIPADTKTPARWQPLNWTTLGQAIYNGTGGHNECGVMTEQAYYNAQREAGKSMKEIRADLTEQGNNDDDPVTIASRNYTGSTTALTTEENDKFTICHRTSSSTNPYRKITVSGSALANSGHSIHTGPVYTSGATSWGDIIPADTQTPARWTAQNWTSSASITGNSDCVAMTTQEYYDKMREEGKTKKEIKDDLKAQDNQDEDQPIDEVKYKGSNPTTEESEPRAPKDPNPTAIDQSLSGIVWLDINRDGLKDPDEPLMKNIQLYITYIGATPSFTPANLKYRGSGLRAASVMRAASVASQTIVTDANGYYSVPSLTAGDWSVTTTIPSDLSVTYDSYGYGEGQVETTVPAGSHAYTWVGLVGQTDTITAQYVNSLNNPQSSGGSGSSTSSPLVKPIPVVKPKPVVVKKPTKTTKLTGNLAYTGDDPIDFLGITIAGLMIAFTLGMSTRLLRKKSN